MDLGTLDLLVYGPDLVNRQSDPVVDGDLEWLPKLKELMTDLMVRCNGVGLSASQVGIFKRYVVVELRNRCVIDLINPEITRLYGREIDGRECCLSIPPFGNECPVPRPEYVIVEASGTDYKRKQWTFRGEDARLVQRILDLTTGTFFIDRVSESRKRLVLEKFGIWKKEWERKGRPFPYEGGELNARNARSFATYGR
jgi:peptide deformylase